MIWITIYIAGKADFREEVRKKLSHSDLKIMAGDVGQVSARGFYDLYWLDSNIDLRTLRQEIGSKLIWKYRLRFYDSLDAFVESQHNASSATSFTDEELAMMSAMRTTTS